MKKHILAVVLSSALASGATLAVELPASGAITTANCSMLGNNVVINLSNGVFGAYACNIIGNAMAITTCHDAGSRQSLVVGCGVVDNGPDGEQGTDDDVYNNGSCPEGDGTAGDGQFTIADFRGYVASTTGGGVVAQELGGNCTAASVDTLLPF